MKLFRTTNIDIVNYRITVVQNLTLNYPALSLNNVQKISR